MTIHRFIYLILAAFLTGTLLLIFIQYNSSHNIDRLIQGNEKLLRELRISNHLRELERDLLWVESRIRAAIATDDTSHIEGVDKKIAHVRAYLDTLRETNTDAHAIGYIERLNFLAGEKLRAKNQLLDSFRLTGRMDNTELIANPRAREVSNEISRAIRTIYDSRQLHMIELSNSIEESGQKARLWGGVLIAVILVSASGWCWFIVERIRQQNRLILQLDESEKKAREAARIKENFMANMSHEIRTPLNAILGFTNLLKTQKMSEESEEFVAAIQSAGENLLTIVNDILDLAKIEAGMVRIEAHPFSVRGLVHSIETMFGGKAREKGLKLKSHIDPAVPDTLIGDATRLTQILVNLIGNALKFTEKGQIRLRINGKPTADNRIELGFDIRDSGIGIDKEKLATIFERFRQAEDSTTRNYGGTGLGLAIVRDLVVLQHGRVEVESEPGKGTTFRFSIPYRIAAEQLAVPSHSETPAWTHSQPPRIKLLVVDDNLMNQTLMKHLLRHWNFSYDIAGSGLEAVEMLQEHTYDLVLMDIQMPKMDGYSASQYIRRQLKLEVPIVAMTAHAMAGEREKCLSYGMNEYVSKPIQEDVLYKIIAQFTPVSQAREMSTEPSAGFDYPVGSGAEDASLVPVTPGGAYHYIDLGYLREISKGNQAYEKMMTELFLESVPEELLALEGAIGQQDMVTLSRVAHKMRSTISIMGLTEVLNPHLDFLEFTPTDQVSILEHWSALRTICNGALQEAAHFQASL